MLHLCYDLIVSIQQSTKKDNGDGDKITMVDKQVRFWTDQLKRTVQIRFGQLGNNIDSVRSAMQHTKLLLRKQDGINYVKYNFI